MLGIQVITQATYDLNKELKVRYLSHDLNKKLVVWYAGHGLNINLLSGI